FYKAALALEGALKTPQTSEQILGIDLQDFSLLMAHESWSPLWYAPFPSMAERYAAKGADPRIFLGETDPMEQGRAAVQHNLFTHVFDRFLAAFTQILAEGETLLEASLTSAYPHRPHYALFLSFLRMSRYQRSALQALGKAHLDFYYRDVLR